MKPILTSHTGNNSDLIAIIEKLYLKEKSVIADVTYGKGNFWNGMDMDKFDFRPTDLMTGTDFGNLPYKDSEIDLLVLDPPYMHGGATIKKSINACYQNNNTSHASVIRLYTKGILEAARVLKQKGLILVKTQDEIESGKQNFSHCELISMLTMLGFSIIDLFVLTQKTVPAMREKYQKTARKNHSYLIIAEFRK